jgi:hypothetical protein
VDHLPEWIVQDVSPGETDDQRMVDVRFFAEDADHAKRQWFELMGLAEGDPDVSLNVVRLSDYLMFRKILGDALAKQQ